ncbi:MAG: hypothetical protein JNL70_22235 [Saprospiraceae bacterium]|nr:hypothetical protein [Saprospiraceae bacterium]
MNVIFHTTVAVGVSVLLTDTERIEQSKKKIGVTSVLAFITSVFSHGIMDYMPHCYPINSKIDVALSFCLMLFLVFMTDKKYKSIVGLSFLGTVFPDLIDLLPSIINKQLSLNLPIGEKLFPWHWHQYSGSIYNGECYASMINHCFLVLIVIIVCWCRFYDFKKIFLTLLNPTKVAKT